MPTKREIVTRYVRDALLRGRPRGADGILVYDALQVAPALEWNEAGYLNFGLWDENTASGVEASEALLAYVAGCGNLADAGEVLDVGFGTGAQTLFLTGLCEAAITGVNQSASQTARARAQVEAAGLARRAELCVGDATALDFPAGRFDVVICVEAAFHFTTREQFIREAYRVLRPGGKLVLADIVPSAKPHWSRSLFWSFFHRTFFAPRENQISIEQYRERLKTSGFDAHLEVLTPLVFVPFFERRAAEYEWWAAVALCRLLVRWFRWRSPCDYIVAVATK